MAVLQHYYTSFVNRESGTAGFQVKAMSPGISAETQSKIARLIAYRIPPTMNEQPVTAHPVALRYYYVGPQECIFLCSQSNGSDENGRPGNFFAHTLVMEPDMFASVPPILYWRSPFWRSKDSGTSSILSPLPSFDEEPSLDENGVWGFLAQGNRLEQFHKLMAAVVHYARTKRRVVIIDTPDNVAMWIAAVSSMLPPGYRPLLSFATYHHDPYQAQFLITGTTPDSSFRASQEEYMSYFVLNADTGKVSDVEPSPYADVATRAAHSMDFYDTELLPFFATSMRRFPEASEIGEELDLMVQYFNVIQRKQQQALSASEIKSIELALTGFEQLRAYDEDDVKDLVQLHRAVSALNRLQGQADAGLVEIYTRVVHLLKVQNAFNSIIVKDDLLFYVQLLVQGQNIRTGGIAELVQIHGRQAVTEVANTPDVLNEVAQLLREQYGPKAETALELIWTYLGPYLQPRQEIMLTSLEILGRMWRGQRKEEANALAQTIVQAMNGREIEWLRIAVEGQEQLSDLICILAFYYSLVRAMKLEQRVPYRRIVQSANPDIAIYELRRDLYEIRRDLAGTTAPMAELLSPFEQWIEHARRQRMDVISLMNAGLTALEKGYSKNSQMWMALVSQILTSRILTPLPPEWEERLVDTALSTISFSRHTPSDIALCKKYEYRTGLSAETQIVIDGLLTMASGHLDQELANRLRSYFDSLSSRSPEAYQAEMKGFISGFLPKCDSPASHVYLFTACCDLEVEFDNSFWSPYRAALANTLANPLAARQSLDLLSFWFSVQPEVLPPYVVPFFFLTFPDIFEKVRKTRGFHDAVRAMNAQTTGQGQKLRWYPLLNDLNGARKNVLVSVGQSVGHGFMRMVSQGDEEAQRRQQLEAQQFEESVSRLFEGRRLGETQRRNFPTVYSWKQRARFWESYWAYFASVVAHNADQTLDLLSFWFNESFSLLGQYPYGAQSFFLGLLDALQMARKERGFSETARQINTKVRQNQSAFQWYPLVEAYFEVRGPKLPLGRRE